MAPIDRSGPRLPLPPGTRIDPVVDMLHGQEVPDPYRWLESTSDPEVMGWVEEQNRHTRELLDEVPQRGWIRNRLEKMLQVDQMGLPRHRENLYFQLLRRAGQDQYALVVRRGSTGQPRVLLDPNDLAPDGSLSLDFFYPSLSGDHVVCGLSERGTEDSVLRIVETATGRLLEDRIPHARHADVAWMPGDGSFYYTRLPEPGSVPAGEEHYHRRVFHHSLGLDWREDPLVFGEGYDPTDSFAVEVSEDGKLLLVMVLRKTWSASDLVLGRIDPDGSIAFTPILEGVDALFAGRFVDHRILVLTNYRAPRFRLLLLDPAESIPPVDRWTEIVPESDCPLELAVPAGDRIILHYLCQVASRLQIVTLDGAPDGEIPLPTIGTAGGPVGRWGVSEVFLGFASYNHPQTVYRFDLESRELQQIHQAKTPLDSSNYEVRRSWFTSRDGTKVSMFVTCRKGLKPTGDHPTILYGYGGFNVPMTPSFSSVHGVWLEMGGVVAVAHLRGGSEYGEEWHRGGMLDRKQNVFDDFIAAAEHLVAEGYTCRERLAIWGGSNGGLLVGAVTVQRPELARAVICSVPVLDMLRYHRFSMGRYWMDEYGDPDDPEAFEYLLAYSPYHQIQDGHSYPSILVTTSDSDTRVDTMHAKKFAARLQAASISEEPILFWLQRDIGHGHGASLSKIAEGAADELAFLAWRLGVSVAE